MEEGAERLTSYGGIKMSIDSILNKVLAGERATIEDTIRLYESNEIEKMGHVANQIMKKWHPEPITTFVIGRNVNYTNVCDTYCRFCAFYRAPDSEGGMSYQTRRSSKRSKRL
jgi:cyclic dehypoxanthinyl futalosine synthase